MRCPECDAPKPRVIETKPYGDRVWRRRECRECGHRFSTDEERRDDLSTTGGHDA